MKKRTNIILVIIIGGYFLFNYLAPFNKNHGIEFNSERLKIGIPEISYNLKQIESSDKYEAVWYDENSKNGHFKKIVEYGFFDTKTETDYYENEKLKSTFLWSKYDFRNKSFKYFIEKPNDKLVSATKNGNLKFEKPTIIEELSKKVFEKHISEINEPKNTEFESKSIYLKADKKVEMVLENNAEFLVTGQPTKANFVTENIDNQKFMVYGPGIMVNQADKDGFRFTITPIENTLVNEKLEIQVTERIENGENFTHKFLVPVKTKTE
ncbi:MAG: hypothetical protein HRT67_06040 [Flavobacteriaceae bacterium]|nr:hypothetical protein [Flavobacteriaceae bacterium]